MANVCAWASQRVAAQVLPKVEPLDVQTQQEAAYSAWTAFAAEARPMLVPGFVQALVLAAEHSLAVQVVAHYEVASVQAEATAMLASLAAMKVAAHAQEVDGLSEAAVAAGGSMRLPLAAALPLSVLALALMERARPLGLPRPMVAVPLPL